MKTKTFKLEMVVDINCVTFPISKSQFDEANVIMQTIKDFALRYNAVTNRRAKQFTSEEKTIIKSLSVSEI